MISWFSPSRWASGLRSGTSMCDLAARPPASWPPLVRRAPTGTCRRTGSCSSSLILVNLSMISAWAFSSASEVARRPATSANGWMRRGQLGLLGEEVLGQLGGNLELGLAILVVGPELGLGQLVLDAACQGVAVDREDLDLDLAGDLEAGRLAGGSGRTSLYLS